MPASEKATSKEPQIRRRRVILWLSVVFARYGSPGGAYSVQSGLDNLSGQLQQRRTELHRVN